MNRFEQVYHDLRLIDEDEDPNALGKIVDLIYKYYLTPKDQVFFRCLIMHYHNKKQREVGVLLNMDQPNLSAKLSQLSRKLKATARFL